MDHQDEYNLDDYEMDNPNLYVTLTASEQNGYLLQEDGRLILTELNIETPIFY